MSRTVDWLYADRGRRAKAGACIGLAAALVAYGTWRGPEATRSFSHVRDHPDRYRGEVVAVSHEWASRGPGGRIRVEPFVLVGRGVARVPAGGAPVSFRGRLEGGGRMRVAELHVHRREGARIAVSAAALAVVAALLLRDLLRR